jgi:DNA-binding CsgD family transcriptional regulator
MPGHQRHHHRSPATRAPSARTPAPSRADSGGAQQAGVTGASTNAAPRHDHRSRVTSQRPRREHMSNRAHRERRPPTPTRHPSRLHPRRVQVPLLPARQPNAQQARRRAIAYGQWHPYADAEPSAPTSPNSRLRHRLCHHRRPRGRQPRHAPRAAVHPPRGHPASRTCRHGAAHPASQRGQPAPGRRGQHRRETSPPSPHRQRLVHGSACRASALPPVHHLPTPAQHHHHRSIDHADPRPLHPAGRTTRAHHHRRRAQQRRGRPPLRRRPTAGPHPTDGPTSTDDLQPHSPRTEHRHRPVAISRALDGQPTQLNHRERRLAAQLLTAQGLSLRNIAARLAINPRTISRYRRDLAEPNDLRKRQAPTLTPS